MEVSQNQGYHFGIPKIRIIVFWDLYWGPTIWRWGCPEIEGPFLGAPYIGVYNILQAVSKETLMFGIPHLGCKGVGSRLWTWFWA